MIVPDDTSRFDRVFDLCRQGGIVSQITLDKVRPFLYWIFEREPYYLDLLQQDSITLFTEKCVVDWNSKNLYVSVEFTDRDVTAFIKTKTENLQMRHSVPLKVTGGVLHYLKQIGL